MYSVREVIQSARRQRGWGQRQLAEASGVSQPNLAAIETGSRVPSLAMVSRLVSACGLQLRFELEPRHADLDAEVARLREQEPDGRLGRAGLVALISVVQLVRHGAPLVLDGPMAARVHGAPVTDGAERVWCRHDQLDRLRQAATRYRRDLLPARPRYDDDDRLVFGEGDQVRIGECTVTLVAAPPAHQPIDLLGVPVAVVQPDKLARYPEWTPRDRLAVTRLLAQLDNPP
jgi:transcriptional regulator with XRE-family HTH domain